MLKIFNTFTGKKEVFQPSIKNQINLYVCGVTVYDLCHIGHGRTFLFFDIVVRYLRLLNFNVKYVRNITDIDDKIILKSIRENTNIYNITDFMINAMHKDFLNLGLISPDYEPRVTHCMKDIICMIQKLIDKKNAYINEYGDVIFSVKSFPSYGFLSGQSLKLLKFKSSDKIKNTKKNILDFVLWKKTESKENSWHSPWGFGRPGWHIECSTMNHIYFKNCIDIHGGGSDLIFPHHENERAQSMCVNKNFYVNTWMHTGMIIVKNKKMSKSLKNIYFLKDILNKYDAEIVRYYFLSTHYRHPIYFCETNINQSKISLEYLYRSLDNTLPMENFEEGMHFSDEFFSAMDDDFNTPKAFATLLKIARQINFFRITNSIKSNKLAFRLQNLANNLGFLSKKPQDFLQKRDVLNKYTVHTIESLVEQRNIARKNKLWIKADNIRKQLASLDIVLEDLSDKTLWRKK